MHYNSIDCLPFCLFLPSVGFCWGGTDVAVHQFADSRNSCDCGEPRGLPTWGSPEGPVLLRLHAFAFRRLLSTSPERPLGHVRATVGAAIAVAVAARIVAAATLGAGAADAAMLLPALQVQHQALIGAWEEHRRRAIEFLKQ